MKIVLTLLVRDEEDIIESTLRYHLLAGVDHIIATDNRSADRTTDILKSYERMGCLEYIYEPDTDYSQEKWVTRMARLAASRYAADWVINCDADEYFHPCVGTLRDALKKVPAHVSMLSISRNDFVATERKEVLPPPVELTYKMNLSLNMKGKTLPPKVIHRGSETVEVHRGNHKVSGPGFEKKAWFRKRLVDSTDIEVFHYPVRSFKQFETKVRNSGESVEMRKNLSDKEFSRVRHWYALFREGRLGEEYAKFLYDQERLDRALADGELVQDTNLKDYFEKHLVVPGKD